MVEELSFPGLRINLHDLRRLGVGRRKRSEVQEEGMCINHSNSTSNSRSQLDAGEVLDRFKQFDEHIHTCPQACHQHGKLCFCLFATPAPALTPQLSNTTTESHTADSQELLFCLLPQAIPKQWELNIYKAVTVCLMFNLVLGSPMLRIAEVTADYTTRGAWCTRVHDSYQDGLSPLQASAEVASCLALCPRALGMPAFPLLSPVSMSKEKTRQPLSPKATGSACARNSFWN